MTAHRDFKRSIRERMKKTGERYTAARAVLLQARAIEKPTTRIAGLFPDYECCGGVCRDTGALRNFLAACGVGVAQNRESLSEALVNGLCGGVGFLYAVFEYKGWPPILSVLTRYDTMPDSYIANGLARLGIEMTRTETTSAATARKALDQAIASQQPALCTVDCVGMMIEEPGPLQMAGAAPTVVTVAGVDGTELLIDDGAVEPRRMSHESFAGARAMYKKGKQRLITVSTRGQRVDLGQCTIDAITATADRFTNAPYKGFASNFGFAGLEKWQKLLIDTKDKKGWPTLFPGGKPAYFGLRRAFDGIEHEFTAPAAGRPIYAQFLREAARITNRARLNGAADLFDKAGDSWSALTRAMATCGDAAVEQGCKLGDSARELFDEAPPDCKAGIQRISRERTSLANECTLSASQAAGLYAELSRHVGEILAIEREAVATMQAATTGK
ncbi:MAG: DUF4872 domain-containing protein [Phycisphaerales bacterium]|nr:DUF4872 domain-containing protein [Phycisphaerales bacterium]